MNPIEVEKLLSILSQNNNYKSHSKFSRGYYCDFEYKDIVFAYDFIEEKELQVDFLVRDKIYAKKLNKFFNFDSANKKFKIFQCDNYEKLIEEINSHIQFVVQNIDLLIRYNLSVVVTTYNRSNKIIRCLESVKNQKNDDVSYEVIIVDDGSNDNSVQVIREFIQSNQLSHFKVYTRPYNSGGPSAPRNDGINLSSAEYVYIVDSDDLLTEDAIREGYRFANANNSDICMLRIGGKRPVFSKRMFDSGTAGKADFYSNKIYQNPLSLYLYKKHFLSVNQIYFDLEHHFTEDFIFISHCLSITNNISILADKDYYIMSDYDGDNVSMNITYDRKKIFQAYMKCAYYYFIARDVKKFSSFLNSFLSFVYPRIVNELNYRDKLAMINSLSAILDDSLLDYQYIEDVNIKKILSLKLKKYDEFLPKVTQ